MHFIFIQLKQSYHLSLMHEILTEIQKKGRSPGVVCMFLMHLCLVLLDKDPDRISRFSKKSSKACPFPLCYRSSHTKGLRLILADKY